MLVVHSVRFLSVLMAGLAAGMFWPRPGTTGAYKV